jgi:branched-chain amino acid transport system substrate-binding protein
VPADGAVRHPLQEAILGARLAFDAVNAAGGIAGRRIRVISLDDAYDPKRTAENARKLIEEHGVLSLFQCAGTPTALAAAGVAEEKAVPFFVAYTGSDALRQKFSRYVFNIKASRRPSRASQKATRRRSSW